MKSGQFNYEVLREYFGMYRTEKEPTVLVLTMFCGEPQYDRCVESVKNQIGVLCRHVVIENMPNVEAHRKLYELINENIAAYDYFVKLDADMEFSSDQALVKIIDLFSEEVDHVQISVFDFLTNSDIRGLNVFSNRTYFDTSKMDKLYVDKLRIIYPGRRNDEIESYKLVYHCYKPSQEQCFAFGVHRALKVCQGDRLMPSLSDSKSQYLILKKVFEEIKSAECNDIRYISLVGSVMVYETNNWFDG